VCGSPGHARWSGHRDVNAKRDRFLLDLSGIVVDAVEALGGDEPTGTAGATAAIMTGFVSAYLDSGGIDAVFAQLHTSFPEVTALADLPETTTGYDGSAGGLAGPSPVRMLRITTTPAVFRNPDC
jgi:hypothetical protein